jgi:hypothetical protein
MRSAFVPLGSRVRKLSQLSSWKRRRCSEKAAGVGGIRVVAGTTCLPQRFAMSVVLEVAPGNLSNAKTSEGASWRHDPWNGFPRPARWLWPGLQTACTV